MFDWALQPTFTLVTTFLFGPYFATVFMSDPVAGQALWGYLTAAAGLIVAFGGPVLGAVADASGARKVWTGVFGALLMVGLCGLWLAIPGVDGRVLPVAASIILAIAAAEFAIIFTNAMMPGLVPKERLGRLSGTGWAMGYVGGLLSLVIAAGLMVSDSETGRTMLGMEPLIPFDVDTHEGMRAIGPFSAFWFLLFALPFFLFTPDVPQERGKSSKPFRDGLAQLGATLRHVRKYKDIVRFLVARMLYVDGLGAIFAFGGIYAAAIFNWGTIELGLFGIILSVTAAVGAFVGGWLDDRFGPRIIIIWSLVGTIVAAVGVVSVDAQTVLFSIGVAPSETGAPPFSSVGEQVYLLFAVIIGVMSGPLQASSRSYLARLAPPDMMTEFFGLYAFSGKVTAFAAPLLVGIVTASSGSQRIGIAAILLFLVTGLVLMIGARRVKNGSG